MGFPAASVDPWRAPAPSPATVVSPPTADSWSLAPVSVDDALTTPSPSFNNPSLTQNIGFAAQSPHNIGFNLSSSGVPFASGNTNGFNGSSTGFNHFPIHNQGSSTASPTGDFDDFDAISNRNKLGASPEPINNGTIFYPGLI